MDGNDKRTLVQEAIAVSHKHWLDELHAHHEKVKDGDLIYRDNINECDEALKHKHDEIHEHDMKLHHLKYELEKAEAFLTNLQ